jgi:hypothetical protein
LLYTAAGLLASECLAVVKKRVVRDAQRKSRYASIQKRGEKVGKKTPAFGFINETGDYLKNGSPGRREISVSNHIEKARKKHIYQKLAVIRNLIS